MRTPIPSVLSMLAFSFASMTPASAHTTVVLVPGQMLGGGYVHAGGASPAIQQPDQPNGVATDGTLVITNLDPTVAALKVRCTAGDCLADGTSSRTLTIAAPGQTEIALPKPGSTHPTGTYRVETIGTAGLGAFGVFRVTAGR